MLANIIKRQNNATECLSALIINTAIIAINY